MTTVQSPFVGLIVPPAWFKPVQDFIYTPVKFFEDTFDRPEDQAIYMLASIFALVCCFVLKDLNGTAF